MPEAKCIEQKNQTFDDLVFVMTLIWAKKSEKIKLLGQEKSPKI